MTGPTESQIARIDALTATGRTNWFALLAYLAFVLVTTLGVEDVDFFVDSRQTELPLVGVSIPTFSFFIFAPILGAALYAYLHLHIRKVTEALAEPPPGTPPLEERIKPWLLNDYVLRKRRDAAIRRRPLDWLASFTTLFLIWWAGPITLTLMWERTWPAHDLWLSALNAICVMVALYAGTLSWQKMRADVRGYISRTASANVLIAILCLQVAWLTLANSAGLWEWRGTHDWPAKAEDRTISERVEAWARAVEPVEARPILDRVAIWAWDTGTALTEIDPPDLFGAALSVIPPEQADLDLARQKYWTAFCARHGIEAEVCYRTPRVSQELPRHISDLRWKWCLARGYDIAKYGECDDEFSNLSRMFRAEWGRSRTALISSIPKPDLENADLRRASLISSKLSGVNFRHAELGHARFSQAEMERADLSGAIMIQADFSGAMLADAVLSGARSSRADFSGARMERAVLSARWLPTGLGFGVARMEGADFSGAYLERANLAGAEMSEADFFRATLDGAFLNSAVLEGALLDGVDMVGATLSDTKLDGATLREADLRQVSWSGEMDPAVPIHSADLRGGIGLHQDHLTMMIGDERTLLPEGVDERTEEVLFVASCWPQEPRGWSSLVVTLTPRGDVEDQLKGRMTEARMRTAFLCAPGEIQRKTGTPWPVDEPPPWEKDPNWEPEDRGPVDP